jgi:hypothetical protein
VGSRKQETAKAKAKARAKARARAALLTICWVVIEVDAGWVGIVGGFRRLGVQNVE